MVQLKSQRIDFPHALEVCARSQQFLERLKSGQYVYVELCFCLNRPEYVQRDESGGIGMTDYARTHLDECCLSFMPLVKQGLNLNVHHSRLNKMTDFNVFEPHYCEDSEEEKEKIKKHIERFKIVKDEILAVAKTLPLDFPGTLDTLIKWRGVTEEGLAEAAALSVKTIQRLRRYEPDKEIKLETVIQLCIGLQLHPILSEYMLRAAGRRDFMLTNLHIRWMLL